MFPLYLLIFIIPNRDTVSGFFFQYSIGYVNYLNSGGNIFFNCFGFVSAFAVVAVFFRRHPGVFFKHAVKRRQGRIHQFVGNIQRRFRGDGKKFASVIYFQFVLIRNYRVARIFSEISHE